MVEIQYMPYEKVIVHEIRKLEVPEFLEWVASQVEAQKQGGTPMVDWIDGIAFVKGEFMASPELVGEQLKGRLHFAVVFFTETSYQEQKKVTVGGREMSVRFNKKSGENPIFVELVKFLKNFEH